MAAGNFGAAGSLTADGDTYQIFRVSAVEGAARLPFSLKVLVENLLRNEDGRLVTAAQIEAVAGGDPAAEPSAEIVFAPARVLLQDFTGVPCLVDLAAMREAMAALGGDPAKVNPLRPAELIIDHSVIADYFAARTRWRATSSWNTGATPGGTRSCAGASGRCLGCGWSRPAPGSATRSTSSTWPGRCSPRTARSSPTRWWAPARTPRWSTGLGCSAGGWAASRPRRRCSASRCPC